MGRKEEIEELQKWLANPNIKTIGIQGLGGIGKSSLAAYLYQNSSFAAKYWADVSQKPDFAAFAEKTIPALGGSVTQTGDTTQLINDLLKCLRQQRCLLVIDNLETLLNEAREFPDSAYQQLFSRWLQQGDTSTLLLTTQEQPKLLQAEKNWYPLAGMTPSDGADLLQKLEIQGTVEELAAFAASVDGHPLTLQLVAGFLRQYCYSQLSGVAELGLQQFDLVYHQAEGVHRDKEDARLEWILEQHLQRLSQEQQNFFVNLSVYRQPFDFRAAGRMLTSPPTPLLQGEGSNSEAFSAKNEGQVVDKLATVKALRELYNRSLLLETEVKDYYKFQPLVQEYLQKQGTDLSAAHEKAIDHYKSQVKPKPWETLEDVRAYLEIFYHLCQLQRYGEAFYTIRDDNPDDYCVDKFLNLRGYNKTRVELYLRLVNFQESKDDFKQWQFIAALTSLGIAYRSLGQYQEAIRFHQQSVEIAREIGHRSGEGNSLGGLGNAYHSLGQYQEAIHFYQQSLEIATEIGDRFGEGMSLSNLANAYQSLGQYQEAIRFYQQSLEIATEIGDRYIEGRSLDHLGNAYNSLGQYQEAIRCHQQSLEIATEIGDHYVEGSSLNNLGTAYDSLGQYQEAIRFHQQSLEIAREIGNKRGECISLGNLGVAYNCLGQYQEAIPFYQQSLDIATKIGARYVEGRSLGNLGNAYNSLKQYQEAIRFYQQSLEIAREIGDKSGESRSLGGLGLAYHSLEQYQEAIRFYQQSLGIAREIGDKRGECISLGGLGLVYDSLGQYQEAIRFYQQSLEIKRKIGDKRGEANSLQNLSTSYYQIGKFKEGYAAAYQANLILQELGLPLEAIPYPNWMKLIAKFAQRGKWQLALCFILGLFAFPFALVWIVSLMLWRVVRAQFRQRS
ncbi:tetratricopeptide repeat protein [Aerosakkonema sp. BLCC-F183]|uniref:tetratricopeptide repeat protein n=1 Tax=Aerosakkonema sp. BLCC-F183 TaxID=3342834 RepID=UPI0035BB3C35